MYFLSYLINIVGNTEQWQTNALGCLFYMQFTFKINIKEKQTIICRMFLLIHLNIYRRTFNHFQYESAFGICVTKAVEVITVVYNQICSCVWEVVCH